MLCYVMKIATLVRLADWRKMVFLNRVSGYRINRKPGAPSAQRDALVTCQLEESTNARLIPTKKPITRNNRESCSIRFDFLSVNSFQ